MRGKKIIFSVKQTLHTIRDGYILKISVMSFTFML